MLKSRGSNLVDGERPNGDGEISGDRNGEGTMEMTGAGGEADGSGERDEIGAAEHLTRQLARVRAKFGLDPASARRSLSNAWTSPAGVEEDESEFIDAVADCLGAGLPLEAALTCWDTGELARDADDEEDETIDLSPPYVPHIFTGRRLLVR